MSQHPVPILRSVAEAYRFAFQNWQRCGLAAAPYLAVSLILMLSQAVGIGSPSIPLLGPILLVAHTLTLVMFVSAVFRLAVRGDSGPGWGLQIAADERRVFLALILVFILVAIVMILGGIFSAVLVNAVAVAVMERESISEEAVTENILIVFEAFGASDWIVVALVCLGFAALTAWLFARLSLSIPATIDQRAIRVLSIWPLSNRQAHRVVLASALTGLPVIAAGLLVYEAISAAIGYRPLELAHTIDQSVEGWQYILRQNEYFRINGLVAIVGTPLFAGLYAYLYKGLRQMAEDRTG